MLFINLQIYLLTYSLISSKIKSPIFKQDILIQLNSIVAQMCDLVLNIDVS